MPKRKYSVFDSEAAIADYNKKLLGFNEIKQRMIKPEVIPMEQQGPNLDVWLGQNGKPSTFAGKMSLAKSMGMSDYTGKPEQDQVLMQMAQGSTDRQANENQMKNDNTYKDKEFALKEKELGLKEKQIESSKAPSADDIANSLMSKYNS